MDRVNCILEHPVFIECMKQNEMAEADRCFCHHDMEHLCAVARIAMLLNIEEDLGIKKDIVYAAAFLHDSGRYLQYLEGIPHETASAGIARQILPQSGYDVGEVVQIVSAITAHRRTTTKGEANSLASVLYRADKMSRNCRFCKVYEECNWSQELKSQKLYY